MTNLRRIMIFAIGLVLIFSNMNFAKEITSNDLQKQDKFRLYKLHFTSSGGEKGVTTFYYDDDGVNHKAIWELLNGTRNSTNYHSYDKDGNLIKKFREFSDNLTSTNYYEYDENGNLLNESFNRSDGVSGTASYIYNEKGRLLKADCKGLNGWIFGEITYEYNDKGQKRKGMLSTKNQGTGTISYEYDNNGNLVKEHWVFGNGSSMTFVYEYKQKEENPAVSYVSSNAFITNTDKYRMIKENYDYSNEGGGPSFFKYDEDGKLIEKIYEHSTGLKTVTSFEFDNNGLLTKSTRKYSNNLTGVFTYEFNKDRKLVSRFFNKSDGFTGSEVYMYDDKGRLKKAYYTNFDSWLTGVILFEHNAKNILSKGHYKGSNGMTAEIEFTVDSNGNIVKIHWILPGNKTQTYTFKYEKIK